MNNKVVIFDFDETLGYFTQLANIIFSIEDLTHKPVSKEVIYRVFDKFPNVFRPRLLEIFQIILNAKRQHKCGKVLIYTNNQGPKLWVDIISRYIDKQLNAKVFDQVIRAFKINGRIVEKFRTSKYKTYDDLIKCAELPKDVEVFFVDDVQYKKMERDNVVYIKIKPYIYVYNSQSIVDFICTFINLSEQDKEDIINYVNNIEKYDDESNSHILDDIVSRKIISHLEGFFNSTSSIRQKRRKTKKRKKKRNKTKKNIDVNYI